jgi:Xaa-Pro aminopeptidase
VGYEAGFETAAPPWNVAEQALPTPLWSALLNDVIGEGKLHDACSLLDEQKCIKTEADIPRLRTVNEIANIGLSRFLESVRSGSSGVELVAEVESAIMRGGTGHRGAKRARAFARVATGPEETVVGFRPMEISTKREMPWRPLMANHRPEFSLAPSACGQPSLRQPEVAK